MKSTVRYQLTNSFDIKSSLQKQVRTDKLTSCYVIKFET